MPRPPDWPCVSREEEEALEAANEAWQDTPAGLACHNYMQALEKIAGTNQRIAECNKTIADMKTARDQAMMERARLRDWLLADGYADTDWPLNVQPSET